MCLFSYICGVLTWIILSHTGVCLSLWVEGKDTSRVRYSFRLRSRVRMWFGLECLELWSLPTKLICVWVFGGLSSSNEVCLLYDTMHQTLSWQQTLTNLIGHYRLLLKWHIIGSHTSVLCCGACTLACTANSNEYNIPIKLGMHKCMWFSVPLKPL